MIIFGRNVSETVSNL